MGAEVIAEELTLEQTIEMYRKPMMMYCKGQFANKDNSEDAYQEAVTKALDFQRRRPGEVRSWKAWLWRVVKNSIYDRHRAPLKFSASDINLEAYANEEAHLAHSNGTPVVGMFFTFDHNMAVIEDVVGDIDRAERAAMLMGILNQLTSQQRTVVIGRFYEGKSFAEIAKEMGEDDKPYTEGAVKALLHRARIALRNYLDAPHIRERFAA